MGSNHSSAKDKLKAIVRATANWAGLSNTAFQMTQHLKLWKRSGRRATNFLGYSVGGEWIITSTPQVMVWSCTKQSTWEPTEGWWYHNIRIQLEENYTIWQSLIHLSKFLAGFCSDKTCCSFFKDRRYKSFYSYPNSLNISKHYNHNKYSLSPVSWELQLGTIFTERSCRNWSSPETSIGFKDTRIHKLR